MGAASALDGPRLREIAAAAALCASDDLASGCEQALAKDGKGLRPRLVMLSGEWGSPAPELERAAAAIELLHVATLVHDDLIDGDRVRRGADAVWAGRGEESAAYVGAWLFARATELMCSCGDDAVELLASTASVMLRGQVRDVLDRHALAIDSERYLVVAREKTAALFACATEVGGMLSGVDGVTLLRLRQFGTMLGIAFQIADDVIDLERMLHGEDGALADRDVRPSLYALPFIYAVEMSDDLRRMLADPIGIDRLDAVRAAVEATNGVDRACALCRHFADRAVAALQPLPKTEEMRAVVQTVVDASRWG